MTAYGQTCLDCTPHTPLHGLFAALSYQTPLIRRLIQAYKYRFVTDLAPLLTGPLVIALRNAELPLPHYLIPVPLHDRRLRWRNFNQSSLIAHILAEKLTPGFPLTLLDQHLQRTRATLPQAKTKHRSERLENLHGAFAWRPPESHPPIDIADASIWLIDDVATTNATLEECARVLKAHGAKSVYGIVIAR